MDTTLGILVIEKHNTHVDEYVVLGREDDRPDGFYTRIACADGLQYWGHYRLTFGEAYNDFEARKG